MKPTSLRRRLLLVLMPAMLAIFALELWQTWRNVAEASDAAYDRSLYGAIKSIDANLSTASGGLGVELPYAMLEFFEMTANDRVYYRVITEDGLVEIGNTDLPLPPGRLVDGRPQFHEALYFGEPVRIGTYARPIDLPGLALAPEEDRRVIIQVAEPLATRADFRRSLLQQAVARDLLLLISAIGLLMWAVKRGIGPLRRLRDGVMARLPEDLTPMPREGVPAEVLPLVDAINQHMARNREQTLALRRFVDDASHQLRTPLSTLTTQVAYALRETSPAEQRRALEAIRSQLDETVRQTNQMLLLGRADSAEIVLEPLDVVPLARAVTRSWWSAARSRGLDLGFEAGEPVMPPLPPALAHAGLLREALTNLLHNAIQYTRPGGSITLAVCADAGQVCLSVQDDGPGLPADELARVGERFFRGRGQADQPGSGLGLAVVQAIAARLGGTLSLHSPAQPVMTSPLSRNAGPGLRAVLTLQAAPQDGAAEEDAASQAKALKG